jgi:hypothetical protein
MIDDSVKQGPSSFVLRNCQPLSCVSTSLSLRDSRLMTQIGTYWN